MINLEVIRDEINEASKVINFNERKHIYKVGDTVIPSVSSVIKDFIPEFPANIIAKAISKKDGIPMRDILRQWEDKRDKAANYGNYIHYHLDKYVSEEMLGQEPKYVSFDSSLFVGEYNMDNVNATIAVGKQFIYDIIENGYNIVDTEVMLYNDEEFYCGTLDLLLEKDGKLVIADWKTNRKDIEDDHYYKRLKYPYNRYYNTTLNKYKIQTKYYTDLVEYNLNYAVSNSMIVHLGVEGYDVYDDKLVY